jgi:hypothetical protein
MGFSGKDKKGWAGLGFPCFSLLLVWALSCVWVLFPYIVFFPVMRFFFVRVSRLVQRRASGV